MSEAETRLATFWVHFLKVVEAWLAPVGAHERVREASNRIGAPCLTSLVVTGLQCDPSYKREHSE